MPGSFRDSRDDEMERLGTFILSGLVERLGDEELIALRARVQNRIDERKDQRKAEHRLKMRGKGLPYVR
jgi:hypothetical protein